jgi:hypothetical protein
LATSSNSPRILNYLNDSRKTNLAELWSDRLLETLIANPSKLHFGQEVLHGDLQGFQYDLGDMHTLNLKMKEDIKFQRGLIVKLLSWKFFLCEN